MLTCTEEIYENNFGFRIFGCSELKTQIYKYFDDEFDDDLLNKKLFAVLGAINTNPLMYSHDEKFKRLEEDVWEIKIKPHRIACLWDGKPYNLIGIYAFKKTSQKWPKKHLENMRAEREKYFSKRVNRIGGNYYGRNQQITE